MNTPRDDYHTPLRDLLGADGAKGTQTAVKAAGHLLYGEWQLGGPLGAPTSAWVRCDRCGDILRVTSKRLEMKRTCVLRPAGQWR